MKVLFLVLIVAVLSCENRQIGSQLPAPASFPEVEMLGNKKAQGQTLHVPIYSSIYHRAEHSLYHLTVTLSIRNISPKRSIHVTRIDYHDSNGKMVRRYIEKPVVMGPLSTKDIVVNENDLSGGTGANFVVEWESEKKVATPLVEAVMISTKGQQGISFISRAKEIETH